MSKEILRQLRSATPGYQAGWGGPEYSGWQDEQMSWKTDCYLGDWSFLMDLEVSGPDALRVFSDSSVNSFESFAIGQAKHVVQCNDAGKVIVEGVLMRMAADVYRVQSGPAIFTDFLISKGGYDVTSREVHTFQLQVSGPKALALCETLTGQVLSDIKFMHFRELSIAGKTVYALRQGMAGEIGFELHGDEVDKAAVEAAILEAGQAFNIRRLGKRTAMINHLEAAFPTGLWHYMADMFSENCAGFGEFIQQKWGHIFNTPPVLHGSFEGESVDDYLMSPYDLGWGKSVKFDHDFTGRAALEQEKAAASSRKRVTLEFDSADVVEIYASLFEEGEPYEFIDMPHPQRWMIWADAVMSNGRTIGISASPGYSFYFRKILTLAFIDPAFAEPGTQVTILWGSPGSRQKHVRATVHPAPYKKDNRRADLGQIAVVEA